MYSMGGKDSSGPAVTTVVALSLLHATDPDHPECPATRPSGLLTVPRPPGGSKWQSAVPVCVRAEGACRLTWLLHAWELWSCVLPPCCAPKGLGLDSRRGIWHSLTDS